jgi:hypothetical protein
MTRRELIIVICPYLAAKDDSMVHGGFRIACEGQGLTLVLFSARPEPFLTQKHTLNNP